MKNDKSPGTDGFSAEFFKMFWVDLGDFLFRSLLFSYGKGILSHTQKQGIITLLPKGNRLKEYLKNWRPITLLNVSYKLISGTIAFKMKAVLDKLVHENQKGFIAGRYIGENTRLLYVMLQYLEENNMPGLLMLIDFEKAFDSVSWEFIFNVLNYFNFGKYFIGWIKTMFNDIKLCFIQNGSFQIFFILVEAVDKGTQYPPTFLYYVQKFLVL